jgi:hypothetical protein
MSRAKERPNEKQKRQKLSVQEYVIPMKHQKAVVY